MYLTEFVRRAGKVIFDYQEPLQYLRGRGLEDEDIRRFGLGYVKVASVPKVASEEYKSLKEDTNGFRSLQRKILFPLRNVLGEVNGLQTRPLDKKFYNQYFLAEAKKIGAFFGLREALPFIREKRKVFVHEGAFDAISFAKIFPNSVSSLTSFLNAQQYELLRFYADLIILVYDADSSGVHGVEKSMNTYGDRYITQLQIGSEDSNACLKVMGYKKFSHFLREKVPISLQ